MNETEELEKLNYEFNEKIKKRKVTNLILCDAYQGKGKLKYKRYLDMWRTKYIEEFLICEKCKKTGYIDMDTWLPSFT